MCRELSVDFGCLCATQVQEGTIYERTYNSAEHQTSRIEQRWHDYFRDEVHTWLTSLLISALLFPT